ncbi:nucleotidyltransferase family protein [Anaerosporobacter sp.]
MKVNRAIIMAGGEGVRMNPITKYFPKCYLPIYDEPLLIKQLKWLIEANVKEVFIALNQKFGDLILTLLSYTDLGNEININLVIEQKTQGIGVSLLELKTYVAGEPFIFLLGDEYYENPSFFKEIKKLDDDCIVMGATSYKDKKRIMAGCNFELKDDRIVTMVEKPKENEIMSEWCWSGVSVFQDSVFDSMLENEEQLKDNRVLINGLTNLIEKGNKIMYLKDYSENINMTDIEDYYTACSLEKNKY